MTILNIHGYHGSSHNSAYEALEALGFNIISPDIDYDMETPHNIVERLKEIAAMHPIEYIVGTSLGGFFAAVLAAKLELPVILINPCLMPFIQLPRLGYTGDMDRFARLFNCLESLDPQNVSCIIGDSDEVIDTHWVTKRLFDSPRFRTIPGGMQSGATLPLKDFFSDLL